MGTKPTILELTMDELEDILRRAEAKQLNDEDYEIIRALFKSYVHLTDLLKDKNASIARLRKMLFGGSTEKTEAVIGSGTDATTASVAAVGLASGEVCSTLARSACAIASDFFKMIRRFSSVSSSNSARRTSCWLPPVR